MSAGYVFVGGPGRSGTSFVADRLGRHPDIAAFQDVELKIFYELGGLFDLRRALTEAYSPNRAVMALQDFDAMVRRLRTGGFGQMRLEGAALDADVAQAFAAFRARLLTHDFPAPARQADFNAAARDLLGALADVARAQKPGARVFLEKTPHTLLQPQFLHELAPGARFIHVYRDPQAIAASLLAQNWGPDAIPAAAEWVRGYYTTWRARKGDFDRFGMAIQDIRIEDLAAQPEAFSARLQDFLGLRRGGNLFQGASQDVLRAWRARAAPEMRAQLRDLLGDLGQSLGYSDDA